MNKANKLSITLTQKMHFSCTSLTKGWCVDGRLRSTFASASISWARYMVLT